MTDARVISDLKVHDWGIERIDLGAGPMLMATPLAIHHKVDGAHHGASLAIEMVEQMGGQLLVVAEVSIAMLQRAFSKLGYQLVDRKDVQ